MPEFDLKNSRSRDNSLLNPLRSEKTSGRPIPVATPLLAELHALGNQSMLRFAKSCSRSLPSAGTWPTKVQTKLKIGQPGDKYEQEADRIAEQIISMPEPKALKQPKKEEDEKELIQPKPLADQITPLVQRQTKPEEEEEEEQIQAKLAEGTQLHRQVEEEEEEEKILTKQKSTIQTPEVTPDLETQINSLKEGGRPLSQSEIAFFEPRFGYDFNKVRICTDSKSAELARILNARAYTFGQEVVFGSEQYTPGTTRGKKLLAHELTHVVQQRTNSVYSKQLIQPQTKSEDKIQGSYKVTANWLWFNLDYPVRDKDWDWEKKRAKDGSGSFIMERRDEVYVVMAVDDKWFLAQYNGFQTKYRDEVGYVSKKHLEKGEDIIELQSLEKGKRLRAISNESKSEKDGKKKLLEKIKKIPWIPRKLIYLIEKEGIELEKNIVFKGTKVVKKF